MTSFVSVEEAVTTENNIDDSIAELDQMVKRLYKIRKQLTKQKKYVSLAKDLLIKESTGTITPTDLLVDKRITKFKHDGFLNLITDNNSGPPNFNINVKDSSWNIFTNASDNNMDADGTGDSLSILQIKMFLSAVNSVLTQPNDTSTVLTTTPAFNWVDSNANTKIDAEELDEHDDYTAISKHKLTTAFPYLITMGAVEDALDDTAAVEQVVGFGLDT